MNRSSEIDYFFIGYLLSSLDMRTSCTRLAFEVSETETETWLTVNLYILW